jgi:lipid-binding SYLF domain-containing protein
MKIATVFVLSVTLLAGAALAARKPQLTNDVKNRLTNATEVFREIMNSPDKTIPQDLLDSSQCIAIIPGMKKGAFIFGGVYGKGFVSCRNKDGVGWTAPGAVTVEGGSFGLQIGGEETDVVLLLMNKHAENSLLSSQFTIGADASAAAGPVGRTATAQTDAYMSAEILSYSRSRGVFAGVSLKGSTLRQDKDVNDEIYGKGLTNKQIIEGQVKPPAPVEPLVSVLDKFSPRQKKS